MFWKKVSNFWYYNKIKVFVAIFAVLVLVVTISTGSSGQSDLEIAYVTAENEIVLNNVDDNIEVFKSLIEAKKNEPVITFLEMTESQFEVEFTLGVAQIVLLDKNQLVNIVNRHFFEPLDSYVDKYSLDIADLPEIKGDPYKKNEYKIYAIPVSELTLLQQMGFPKDYYIAVRLPKMDESADVIRNKNAHAVLDYILDYNH